MKLPWRNWMWEFIPIPWESADGGLNLLGDDENNYKSQNPWQTDKQWVPFLSFHALHVTHQGTFRHHSGISTSPGTHHNVVWTPDAHQNIQKEGPHAHCNRSKFNAKPDQLSAFLTLDNTLTLQSFLTKFVLKWNKSPNQTQSNPSKMQLSFRKLRSHVHFYVLYALINF